MLNRKTSESHLKDAIWGLKSRVNAELLKLERKSQGRPTLYWLHQKFSAQWQLFWAGFEQQEKNLEIKRVVGLTHMLLQNVPRQEALDIKMALEQSPRLSRELAWCQQESLRIHSEILVLQRACIEARKNLEFQEVANSNLECAGTLTEFEHAQLKPY